MRRLVSKTVVALYLCAIFFAQCQTKEQGQPGTLAGEIYRKASPAVVLIETLNEKHEVAAAGSGFLVSSDGKILTNYHVIAHTKEATVRLANKDAYDTVDVLDIDKRKDIALIKIKAVDLPFLTVGKSSAVDIGDQVFSLSTPLGVLQNTLSNGIVSGIRAGDGYRYFQVTAPISHGSSGSPIFNSAGEVIGIAAMTISEGQNLNFAIPIDYAKGMLASPSQPRTLAAIYEPEPEPEPEPDKKQPGTAEKTTVSATPVDKTQDEMKKLGIGVFLERRFGIWTLDDAKVVLGEPHGHRFGVGDPMPEIWAYDDPTKVARQVELLFDAKTKMLHDFYMYPVNMTWEDCKKVWGDNVKTQKGQNGNKFYMYKNRHMNVLVAPNGTVLSVGVYAIP
jgi:S1-C subfamily serine protease